MIVQYASRRLGRLAMILGAVALAFGLSAAPASAAPVFFGWGGEKIIKVADFPHTPDFTDGAGKHFDPGIRFKQVTFFFIPIWNYDVEWCGAVEGDDSHYLDIKHDVLEQAATAAGIKLPSDPPIPAWDAWEGKILVAAIVGGYLLFMASRRKAAPAAAPPTEPVAPPAAPPSTPV